MQKETRQQPEGEGIDKEVLDMSPETNSRETAYLLGLEEKVRRGIDGYRVERDPENNRAVIFQNDSRVFDTTLDEWKEIEKHAQVSYGAPEKEWRKEIGN